MGNIFILISIAFNVAGQSVLKAGVNKLGALTFSFSNIFKAFTDVFVIGGLFLYLVSSVFWILALSHKDLSYAYPMLSLGYLIVLFVSWKFLGESITPVRLLGVMFISIGLALVFRSATA